MWRDPIVEEVRAIRDVYAKQFDYDIDSIYRDLKNQEDKSGRKVILLQAKRIQPVRQKGPKPEAKVN